MSADHIEMESAALRRLLLARQEHLEAWLTWAGCDGCADPDLRYEAWNFQCLMEKALTSEDEEPAPPPLGLPSPDLFTARAAE